MTRNVETIDVDQFVEALVVKLERKGQDVEIVCEVARLVRDSEREMHRLRFFDVTDLQFTAGTLRDEGAQKVSLLDFRAGDDCASVVIQRIVSRGGSFTIDMGSYGTLEVGTKKVDDRALLIRGKLVDGQWLYRNAETGRLCDFFDPFQE